MILIANNRSYLFPNCIVQNILWIFQHNPNTYGIDSQCYLMCILQCEYSFLYPRFNLGINTACKYADRPVLSNVLLYSMYYKPMMYYKPTPLFSSKFLYRYRTFIYGNSHYKPMMYYKPTLFRVRIHAHGLIIRTIR